MTRENKYYGKKIGTLEVKLDRKKNRHQHASVKVELRFNIDQGTFWAQWEGAWYSADTKDALEAQIKIAATKSLSIEWKRYIQISYEAQGWPIVDKKSGRPAISGRYQTYGLKQDRAKFEGEDEKYAICAVELQWEICEISEPYNLPEDPKKRVRARRDVSIAPHWDEDAGSERLSDPKEWDDDVMPGGTFLWSPEREAVLVEIITALGNLDRRLVDLFAGDAEQLAAKIDAAAQTDSSRLLGTGTVPEPSQRKRRRA